MNSARNIIITLTGILLYVLCLPVNSYAQEANGQGISQQDERELYNRVLSFAIEEYKRAEEYASRAERRSSPSDRTAEYRQMRSAIEDAKELFNSLREKPSQYEHIPALLTRHWANEHNRAVNLLTNDEIRQTVDNPVELAMIHLENAIIIQPDSSHSYEVLASLKFEKGDTTGAITSYEMAMQRMKKPGVDSYESLLELYFIQHLFDDAVELGKQARNNHPDEVRFAGYLADAYLMLGDSEPVITLIRELIEEDPDNPKYYQLLGTQIYQYAQTYLDGDGYAEIGDDRAAITGAGVDQQEGEQLIEEAIAYLTRAAELEPENEEAFHILGAIHQNKAVEYFEKRDNTEDQMLALDYDDEGMLYLSQAVEYYEKVADINPSRIENWEILLELYEALGVRGKAEEAREKLEVLSSEQ
jgi:tetratricopeptide (TPR) repeat protein